MSNDRQRVALATWLVALLVLSAGLLPRGGLRSAAAEPPGQPGTSPRAALSLRYSFSGVTDDGAKGAATRKEATAILCTNLAAANTTIEVRVFNWNGNEMGSASVLASPNTSFTFSTQNTTIYFDDVIFGTGGGTDSIFQGFGQVWSDLTNVVCTAEVLDPLGHPPAFMGKLTLFTADGFPVTADQLIFGNGFES